MTVATQATPLALARVRDLCVSGAARQIRTQAALSLREVAGYLNVSIATLSEWELGTQRPTGDRAIRYGKLLSDLAGRPGAVSVVRDSPSRGGAA